MKELIKFDLGHNTTGQIFLDKKNNPKDSKYWSILARIFHNTEFVTQIEIAQSTDKDSKYYLNFNLIRYLGYNDTEYTINKIANNALNTSGDYSSSSSIQIDKSNSYNTYAASKNIDGGTYYSALNIGLYNYISDVLRLGNFKHNEANLSQFSTFVRFLSDHHLLNENSKISALDAFDSTINTGNYNTFTKLINSITDNLGKKNYLYDLYYNISQQGKFITKVKEKSEKDLNNLVEKEVIDLEAERSIIQYLKDEIKPDSPFYKGAALKIFSFENSENSNKYSNDNQQETLAKETIKICFEYIEKIAKTNNPQLDKDVLFTLSESAGFAFGDEKIDNIKTPTEFFKLIVSERKQLSKENNILEQEHSKREKNSSEQIKNLTDKNDLKNNLFKEYFSLGIKTKNPEDSINKLFDKLENLENLMSNSIPEEFKTFREKREFKEDANNIIDNNLITEKMIASCSQKFNYLALESFRQLIEEKITNIKTIIKLDKIAKESDAIISNKNKEVSTLKEELSNTKNELNSKNNELIKLNNRNDLLKEELNNTLKLSDNLNKTLTSKKDELITLKNTNKNLYVKINNLTNDIEKSDNKIKELKVSHLISKKELKLKLESLTNKFNEQSKEKNELYKLNKVLQDKINTLDKDKIILNTTINELKSKLENIVNKNKELINELSKQTIKVTIKGAEEDKSIATKNITFLKDAKINPTKEVIPKTTVSDNNKKELTPKLKMKQSN